MISRLILIPFDKNKSLEKILYSLDKKNYMMFFFNFIAASFKKNAFKIGCGSSKKKYYIPNMLLKFYDLK